METQWNRYSVVCSTYALVTHRNILTVDQTNQYGSSDKPEIVFWGFILQLSTLHSTTDARRPIIPWCQNIKKQVLPRITPRSNIGRHRLLLTWYNWALQAHQGSLKLTWDSADTKSLKSLKAGNWFSIRCCPVVASQTWQPAAAVVTNLMFIWQPGHWHKGPTFLHQVRWAGKVNQNIIQTSPSNKYQEEAVKNMLFSNIHSFKESLGTC